MTKNIILSTIVALVLLMLSQSTVAQPFSFKLDQINIDGFNGVQSFAFGENGGKWVIIGGRRDGLHRRQPWASFDEEGANTSIIVIDPILKKSWTKEIDSLPNTLKEQLSSTNMQFYQLGNYLYCIGGYGYSKTEDEHTTFKYLTAINIEKLINAITNKLNIADCFKQISDTAFQVTGGRLRVINDTFYLMGGQKFIGKYNPMGPTHGPGFSQQYTNAIKVFTVNYVQDSIHINHIKTFTNTSLLHKRDYNAEPQILSDSLQSLIMFSGVFKQKENLPHTNAILINSKGYKQVNEFNQFFNHYHCAVMPIYSRINKEMYNVFFGGIAQYFDSLGMLTQDENVPFVKTISMVTVDEKEQLKEWICKEKLPTYLGAGSEFIAAANLPKFSNGVIDIDRITDNEFCIGYIVGGIISTAQNIFWENTGVESNAASGIYKVIVSKKTIANFFKLNEQSYAKKNISIKLATSGDNVFISELPTNEKAVTINILDENNTLLKKKVLRNSDELKLVKMSLRNFKKYKSILIEIKANNFYHKRRLIL